MSADGHWLAVGASREQSSGQGLAADPSDNSITTGAGAAYIYTRALGVWRHHAYLKSPNLDAEDQFARNVVISLEGSVFAATAPEEDSAATGINGTQADNSFFGAGAAYVFE